MSKKAKILKILGVAAILWGSVLILLCAVDFISTKHADIETWAIVIAGIAMTLNGISLMQGAKRIKTNDEHAV